MTLYSALMTPFITSSISNHIGMIQLDRPKALNSLSLDMVRALTQILLDWRQNEEVRSVFIYSSSERAFCAGGDIRFFYDVGQFSPQQDSALLEDFFTEEYALNHLIHFYPKPYIALLDGVVMGGGMGIAQSGVNARLRIVTERTKMAMPEVNIGLFPDVGGGYFLNRTPNEIGTYLGLTGAIIHAADALYADLADVFIPSEQLPALFEILNTTSASDVRIPIRQFAVQFAEQAQPSASKLAQHQNAISQHFQFHQLKEILNSLQSDGNEFSQATQKIMALRSPLLMAVTLEQLRRCAKASVAECLRLERTMVRHCFKHGEVIEGIRALVVDKDNQPKWNPPHVDEVNEEMVQSFFANVWPEHAHPLRHLD